MCKYLLSIVIILLIVVIYMGYRYTDKKCDTNTCTPKAGIRQTASINEKFVQFNDDVSYVEFDKDLVNPTFVKHIPLSSKDTSDNRYSREAMFKNRFTNTFTSRPQYDMGDTRVVSSSDSIISMNPVHRGISELNITADRDSRKPYKGYAVPKTVNQLINTN